jgi:hypothetical protein
MKNRCHSEFSEEALFSSLREVQDDIGFLFIVAERLFRNNQRIFQNSKIPRRNTRNAIIYAEPVCQLTEKNVHLRLFVSLYIAAMEATQGG